MTSARVVSLMQGLTAELQPVESPWALTGSAGLVLQGGDVPVHDLDVQTTARGAYEIARELRGRQVKRPVRFVASEEIRSHFGTVRWKGVSVDIIGDPEKKDPDGRWHGPPDLPSIIRRVEVGNRLIPGLDLRYEARAYRLLGRHDRANRIERIASGGSLSSSTAATHSRGKAPD